MFVQYTFIATCTKLHAHITTNPQHLCGERNYASCGLTDYFTDRDTHTFLSLALIHTNVHNVT